MNDQLRALRRYVPAIVLLSTVALGWMLFVRPLSAERSRTATRLDTLRQRELALTRAIAESSVPALEGDPVAEFERQIASSNASPAVLEHLARLASNAGARHLLIETVEASTTQGGSSAAPSAERDPRFGLFDVPVTHVPIRLVFDTGYAEIGRFLWSLRDLPTTVEVRALTLGIPQPASGDDTPIDDGGARGVRVSLTLLAYSRSVVDTALHASNTVTAR